VTDTRAEAGKTVQDENAAGDFFRHGRRLAVMRKRLATEIALVIGAKLAALFLLYFLFFDHAVPVDAASHLMGH
jgi:hypothetical protein